MRCLVLSVHFDHVGIAILAKNFHSKFMIPLVIEKDHVERELKLCTPTFFIEPLPSNLKIIRF